MKNLLLIGMLSIGLAGTTQTYNIDAAHSSVAFKVRHLGITSVNGNFSDYTANVTMEGDDLSTVQAEATIQVGSIDTGIERRDGHLLSDDFFSAETYPTMTFVSKEVRNVDGEEFELVGDLTIRDVTNEVVLEVEYTGSAMMGETKKVAFEAEGKINRFDYGLQWDRLTEAGGLVVGEDVRLILELQANAQ